MKEKFWRLLKSFEMTVAQVILLYKGNKRKFLHINGVMQRLI